MPTNEVIAAIAAANEAMTEYAKAWPGDWKATKAGIGSAEFKKASEAFAHATAECAEALSNTTSDEELTAIEQLTDQLMNEHARKVLRLPEIEILRINTGAFDDDDAP
jgi:hypothetical protein